MDHFLFTSLQLALPVAFFLTFIFAMALHGSYTRMQMCIAVSLWGGGIYLFILGALFSLSWGGLECDAGRYVCFKKTFEISVFVLPHSFICFLVLALYLNRCNNRSRR